MEEPKELCLIQTTHLVKLFLLVGGGIFKNTNISNLESKWIHITDGLPDNIPVSKITYDPNNKSIFYGTGESYTGADALGNGLWK